MEIDVLRLGEVRLPDTHPRATESTCVVQGTAIRHPDGVIVFDTGVAAGHPVIDALYAPTIVPIVDALNEVGLDEREVVAIVNSHLHFDHCGQNDALAAVPVWVQRAEYECIDRPHYTVPEWAHVDVDRRRTVDGDTDLVGGVRIVATPGHSPGHQSLVVSDGDHTTVLAGQCCFTCTEFDAGAPAPEDAHDMSWQVTAVDSVARLRALRPDVVHLSHDAAVWRRR